MRAEALGGSPLREAELKIHMTHGGQERLRSQPGQGSHRTETSPPMSAPNALLAHLPRKIQHKRQPAVSERATEEQGTRRSPLGAKVTPGPEHKGRWALLTPVEKIATKLYLITKNPREPLPPRHRSGHVMRLHSGCMWMAKWEGSQWYRGWWRPPCGGEQRCIT